MALARGATRDGCFGDASARDDGARTSSERKTFVNDAGVTLSAIGAPKNNGKKYGSNQQHQVALKWCQ